MKKTLTLGIASLAFVGLIGVTITGVNAQSGNNWSKNRADSSKVKHGKAESLEMKAKILNVTPEQLKTELETKKMKDLLAEKNISHDSFHEQMKSAAMAKWSEKGLSEKDVQEKMNKMETRHQKNH